MPKDERLGNFVEEHLKTIHPFQEVVVISAFEHHKNEVHYKEYPYFQIQILYRKKWPIISHYRALKKAYRLLQAKGYQFNLAHLHVTWPSGIVFLGFLKSLPFIITEHYSGYQKKRQHEWSKLAQYFALKVLNRAKVVCPVSEHLGKSLQEFGLESDFKAIGNVVNPTLFHYRPKATNSGPFKLLHISSLQEETKNIIGILNAYEQLLKQDSNFILKIGGDGDLGALRLAISERNIPATKIEILEAMNRREVADQISDSDAFLLFSFIENQPVVILEALSIGRPVISSDVGGIKEILSDANGILVPPRDEAALVKAILKMKGDYKEYNLSAIAEQAAAEHSKEAIAVKFLEVYTSVPL